MRRVLVAVALAAIGCQTAAVPPTAPPAAPTATAPPAATPTTAPPAIPDHAASTPDVAPGPPPTPPPPPPLGEPTGDDRAAEREFIAVDRELSRTFDFDTGHQPCMGGAVEVIRNYERATERAQRFDARLQAIQTAYETSKRWVPVILARRASLHDSLQAGLMACKLPALKLFTDTEEKLLGKLETSGTPEYQEKAIQFRNARWDAWRAKRATETAPAVQTAVRFYLQAIATADASGVTHPDIVRARVRLGELNTRLSPATPPAASSNQRMSPPSRPPSPPTPGPGLFQ